MNKPRAIRLTLAAVILLVTLFFGLDPKGYDFSNHVSWLSDRPGIHFDKYGIAYTQLDKKLLAEATEGRGNFTLQMVFQPGRLDQRRFTHILSVHGGRDRGQLVVGQWRTHIIVMNGDDYALRRKTKRLSAKLPSCAMQPVFLSVTFGKNGASMFLDGRAVVSEPGLSLVIPVDDRPALILGNSVYGKHSWQGDFLGLALYDRELPPATIADQFKAFSDGATFASVMGNSPVLLYLFDEGKGNRVLDHAGGASPLVIPESAVPLKKIILAKPFFESGLSRSLFFDAIINLIGFIPMGFFSAALLIDYGGGFKKRVLFFAVLFCFGLSFAMEILQAWMPSRSSQSLDLILNIFGGWTGAILLKSIHRYTTDRGNVLTRL